MSFEKLIFFSSLSGGIGTMGAYFIIEGNTFPGIIFMALGLGILLMIKKDM